MIETAIEEAFHKASNAYWESSVLSETSPDRLKAACRAYAAALSALHAKAGVSVASLEWKQWSHQRGWQADCVVGQYQVAFLGEKEVWQLARAGKGFSDHQSSEAAKAAAQVDYEARIRSALSTKLQEPVGVNDTDLKLWEVDDYLVDQTIELLRLSDKGKLVNPLGVTAYALLRGLVFNRIKDQAMIAELQSSKSITVDPVGYVTETDISDARTLGVGRLFGASRDNGIPVYTSPPSSEMYLALKRIQDAGLKGFLSPELCADIVNATLAHQPVTAGLEKDSLMTVVASLGAAISLLEQTPKSKKAAASDKMFDQMIIDYKKALGIGRAALKSEGRK